MEFPFSIYFYRHLITAMMGISKPLYGVKYRNILKYMESDLKDVLDKYKDIDFDATEPIPKIIWALWWQGNQSEFPAIYYCCKKNQNTKGFEFHLITKENIFEYVYIDDILPLIEQNKIRIQSFSDIVRMRLLKKYGGIWADAGLFTLKDNYYEELASKYSFYTLKIPTIEKWMNVSEGKWLVGFWASQKNNPFFAYVDDAFTTFVKKHQATIDYYQLDFTTMLGYIHIPFVKKLFDSIPPSNPDFFWLGSNINKPFNQKKWNELESKNDVLRLTWRISPKPLTKNEKLTYWGYLNKLKH